ncbi:MBL fold metallo-hydrolase [Streptomyces sp. TLI_171]|uniref:MBL fold metallo-hydrolase n=1 Tax=Streptomyces sp. TLI_171 TaxID=1938859 RepID=UPI000C1844C3|nr:MBL fold metallo-hydrolase [Streptomyces sp. TLI_171]RKE23186.1 L-ascorbate metabolism protein UlaG (beta-lactamase superfamily) [Streptomyces sp. TLI_171]
MRLTKYAHACVRIEDGDRSVLIDPGCWTAPEAFHGVRAVLFTHEHADHVDEDLLAAARAADPELQVYTHADLAAELGGEAVAVGDRFTAGGFEVRAVGGRHAETIDGYPNCANLGFLVEGVYHPGDALHRPEEDVRALLLPASGPWLSLRAAIEMVRAVRPEHTFPIHDANLSEIGMANFDGWLGEEADTRFARIALGKSVDLP